MSIAKAYVNGKIAQIHGLLMSNNASSSDPRVTSYEERGQGNKGVE